MPFKTVSSVNNFYSEDIPRQRKAVRRDIREFFGYGGTDKRTRFKIISDRKVLRVRFSPFVSTMNHYLLVRAELDVTE